MCQALAEEPSLETGFLPTFHEIPHRSSSYQPGSVSPWVMFIFPFAPFCTLILIHADNRLETPNVCGVIKPRQSDQQGLRWSPCHIAFNQLKTVSARSITSEDTRIKNKSEYRFVYTRIFKPLRTFPFCQFIFFWAAGFPIEVRHNGCRLPSWLTANTIPFMYLSLMVF